MSSVEPSTIIITYDPATQKTTPAPSTVTVNRGDSAVIIVKLALIEGATGTIVFNPDTPIAWSNGMPDGVTVALQNYGTQVTITDPNRAKGNYDFNANFTYKSLLCKELHGTGDPTLINEGTGGPPV